MLNIVISFPFLIFPPVDRQQRHQLTIVSAERWRSKHFLPILFLKLFEMIFWKLQSSIVYSLVSEFFQLHHTMLESVQINICRLCRLCPVWDTRLFIFSLLSDPILSSESSFFFHNHLFAFHTCTNQAEACTRVFFRPCSCL